MVQRHIIFPAPASRGHAGALAGVLALLCLAGCNRAAQPRPQPGTAISIGVSLPKQTETRSGVQAVVDSLTLESPISIGWDGTPVGKVVDDWQWADGGLTLRLHLRPNVSFHDGTPFTNVVAAEIIQSGLRSPRQMALSASLQSVTPEGTEWIVIRTAQREGFLLSDISTLNFSLPGQPDIGTGPFVLDSRSPIRLRANDTYRLGAPAIRSLGINEYDSQRAAWAAMMRGDVDVLFDVSSDAVEFINAENAVQIHSFTQAYYNLLLVNLEHPILGRAEVRKALNEAVHRDEIVKFGLRGKGSPAIGPVWPHHWAYDSGLGNPFRYDPAAAGRRLDAAGLPAGVRRPAGQMPSRFAFTCLVVQEDAQLERVALVLQKQLFEIGVDMQLRSVPLGQLMRMVVGRDYDAALTQFASTRSLSFIYGFWRSPTPGVRSFFNAGYTGADAPLDALRAALTHDEIRAAVTGVQRAFAEDPPAVFLDWMETSRAVRATIDVPAEPGRDIFGSIHQWKPVADTVASR